ncbi:MAG: hypothetical protein E7294_04350 [Lachnospiraceae bacterium]|nr:hypothetical protein [Lachnospiraceae bacterium]
MAGIHLTFDSRYVYSPFTGRGMTGDPNAPGTKSTGFGVFCHAQNTTGAVTSSAISRKQETIADDTSKQAKQMRELLRELKQTTQNDRNPYSAVSKDKANGFLELSGSPENEDEEKDGESFHYNFKEVETKIQRAKTSVSAGQAVISAKRKVLEVKRKIACGGDAEEMQGALIHARRMEMVAKKKKHHLELEELAETTHRRDERMRSQKEGSSSPKNQMPEQIEEELTAQADAIFEKRQEMAQELSEKAETERAALSEKIAEKTEEFSEEMFREMNEMLSEFGEEELRKLEEGMELFSSLEIIDPHMSEEELEELKRKHRASEQKDMMKADMDYLKTMIKQQMKGNSPSGMGSGGVSFGAASTGAAFGGLTGCGISAPSVSVTEGASIDVQI